MGLAVSLSGVAKSLIDSFGDDIVIRTIVAGVYDPITGETADTVTDTNAKGVYTDSPSEDFDGKMTIHSEIAIDLHSTIIHNGMERRIIDIVNVQAQNTIMIYEVIVSTDNKHLQ